MSDRFNLSGAFDQFERASGRAAATTALVTKPEHRIEAAKASRLGHKLGLDPLLIRGQTDQLEAQRQARIVAERSQQSRAYADMVSQPRSREFAVHDEALHPLAMALEAQREIASSMMNIARRHQRPDERSWLARARDIAARGLIRGGRDVIGAAQNVVDLQESLDVTAGAQRTAFGGTIYDPFQRFFQSYGAGQKAELARYAPVTSSNRYINMALQGLESVPQSMAALVAAAITRNPAAALAPIAAIEQGSSYVEARERGLSVGRATGYAAGQATFEVAGERLPIVKYIEDLNIGSSFFKTVLKQVAAESVGEQFTGHLQEFNEWATFNSERTFGDFMRERPEAALNIAIATAAAAGTSTVLAESTRRGSTRLAEAATARRAARNVDQIMGAATQSSVRKESPEDFKDIVARVTDGQPGQDIYIPADAVRELFQSPEDLADDSFWGSYADQIDEASTLGGDVVIPLAEAATHLAGSPQWEVLKDRVRASPGGTSRAEATEFETAFDDAREQTAQQLEALVEQQRAAMEPVEKVFESMRDKLMQSGFTPDVAANLATSFAQRQATRAQRLGTALTGQEADVVEVRQVLPERLGRIQAADGLDILITTMKRGRDAGGLGTSLLEFIADRGGIEDVDGDLKAMGADRWHRDRSFRKRLVRAARDDRQGSFVGGGAGNTRTPDAIAMEAWEAGYFPNLPDRPTVDDLYEAMREEIAGRARFVEEATAATDEMRMAAQDLYAFLDQQGIDPDKASPGEIRDLVTRFQTEAAEGSGYDQSWTISQAQEVVDQAGVKGVAVTAIGSHGPVLEGLAGRWEDAVRVLTMLKSGDARGVLSHPSAPSIDVIYGDTAGGLKHVLQKHPEIGPEFQDDLFKMKVLERSRNRLILQSETSGAIVALDFAGGSKTWLLTAFGRPGADTIRSGATSDQAAQSPDRPEFDDIASKRSLDQSYSDGPRGRITFTTSGKSIIDLFEERDLSTFIHESGHLYLEELKADAEATLGTDGNQLARQLFADWETVKAWFAANGHPIGDDGVIPTEAHELWARGFERFAMEGKAPSSALKRAFEAFRSWMLTIYKVVENLRAPITPEIRDVMRRLLATDEEISLAIEEQNIRQLFKTPEEAAMTAQEFASYTRAAVESRDEAYEALLYRTMATVRAERTKSWKAEQATVRAEVTEQVDAQPVMQALRALRTGSKLPRQHLIESYGADALDLMPRSVPPIYADKNTMHPDALAELTGFESGDGLVRSLMGHEQRRQELRASGDKRSPRVVMIEERTAEVMAERHGDPLRDGSIEEEARVLIHNDRRGEVIAAELRSLGRRAMKRPTPYSVARQWAAEKIASGRVVDVISGTAIQQYQRQARQAGKAAEAAMLAQDIDETFRQKQAQMLNSALVSEARKAKDKVDAAVRRMGKTAAKRTIASVDQDYLDQAHQLMEQVDFRTRSQRDIDKVQAFATWHADQLAQGSDPVVPESFAERLGQRHWTRLSVEELVGLDETVRQVLHLGRLKQTLLDGQERRAREEVLAEMEAQGSGLKQRPPTDLNDPDRNWLESTKSKLRGADAGMIKIEQMVDWLDGGNSNGIFNRTIFRPLAEAQGREADLMRDYVERMNEAVDAMPKAQLRDWNRRVDTPELLNRTSGHPGQGEAWSLFKDQIVMIAMNWGNAGNRQRLLDGYGWNEAEVEAVLDRLMTAEDWQFVQMTWEIIDGLWPEVEALERRVNGFAPEKVEAIPVETRHGTFGGGYFPAVYDPRWSTQAASDRDADLLERGYTKANVRAGSTKQRAQKVSRPMLLSMEVITRHLGEVIHDVTHREALTETWRIVSEPRVQRVIANTLGPEYGDLLRPWLKHIANDNARNANSNSAVVGIFRRVRMNVTLVGLGYRFTSVIAQIAGMPNIIAQIGERRMMEGWARFLGGPPWKAYQEVTSKSAEMRDRFSTMDRDIVERAREMGKQRGVSAIAGPGWFTKYAFHGILVMDSVLTSAGWIGAYRKATAEGMSEEEAIYYADKVVRKSQGAGGAKDQAAITRDHEAVKLFTMFFSYFSALYNQQRDLAHRLRRVSGTRDFGRTMHFGFWVMIMPPLIDALIRGELPAEGDEEEEETVAAWGSKKILFGNIASIPGIREIGGAFESGFGYKVSPVQNIGEGLFRSWGDVQRAWEGDEASPIWLKRTLTTLGLIAGKPTGQIAGTAQFGADVASGEVEPDGLGDWWEGVTSGRVEED